MRVIRISVKVPKEVKQKFYTAQRRMAAAGKLTLLLPFFLPSATNSVTSSATPPLLYQTIVTTSPQYNASVGALVLRHPRRDLRETPVPDDDKRQKGPGWFGNKVTTSRLSRVRKRSGHVEITHHHRRQQGGGAAQ